MSDANDDTLPGDTGDTVVATPASQPSNPSVSGARIRPSRPSHSPVATDYPQLTTVDPAHYVIGREIARGGMGRIQIAHDRRLGRDVAVKEVLVATGSIARRFEREARITARLQHPSIISVHEAGKWPSGEPFYAMRLVTGRSLDEAIDAAKTYAQRLALLPSVLAVADAMAYAHGQKVIHRDLKPKNIIVGDFGETVVIDWGLAKELGVVDDLMASFNGMPTPTPFTESQPGETTLGEVLGTPQYMPPEQATGEPVDERADVYAIGSILYHVLAGRPPYLAESNAELIAALHAAPPLPIARFAPEVSQELIAVAERAMARDRDGRYPTAKELAEDLRRFQTGQLVGAHRYSLRQLLGRWVRRNRTGLAAAAAALLVAVTVGVVAVRRIVAAESSAQRERAAAIANGKRAQELSTFMLGDLRDKLADAGKLDLLDSVAKRAIASYDDATSADELMLAIQGHMVIGVSDSQRGDMSGTVKHLERARDMLLPLVAAHPDEPLYLGRLFDVQRNLAIGLTSLGRRGEAERIVAELDPAVLAAMKRFPTDQILQRQGYTAHVRVSQRLRAKRSYPAALAELKEALAIAEHLQAKETSAGDTRRALLFVHGNTGDTYDAAGDPDAALGEYRLGLGISFAAVATAPNNVWWLQQVVTNEKDISDELSEKKDYAGARDALRTALVYARRATQIDPGNASAIDTRMGVQEKLGILAYEQKDYDAALEAYSAFAADAEELAARDPKDIGHQRSRSLALNKLGDVAEARGDYATAIARYRQALPIREAQLERDATNPQARRDLFFSHYRLGSFHKKLKDDASYAGELRTALEIAEQTHKLDPTNETFAQDLVQTLVKLAEVDKPEAHGLLARAADIARAMAALPKADARWTSDLTEIETELKKH